jgi:hypothetical protein
MRTACSCFALAFAAMLVTSACGGADLSIKQEEKPAPPDAATVEVDLFSGRPNPTWSLTPEEVAHLVGSVDELAPAAAREAPGWLGYRGLRFRLFSQGREIASAESFDEHLSRLDAAGIRHLADPGRKVERWLLGTGEGRIEPEIYDACRTEAESHWTRKKEP